MRINIIGNPEPFFIEPEMMELNKIYRVWYGDSSDLYCMLDNNNGEDLIYFDGCLNAIYPKGFGYLIEEGHKLEPTDLQLTITLAPSHYTVLAKTDSNEDIL